MAKSIDIPVASIAKDITVQVNLTGFRWWHLRLRLGMVLMRLAIWVAGMGCEIGEFDPLPPLPDPNKPSLEARELMFSPRFIEAWTAAREQDIFDSGADDAP